MVYKAKNLKKKKEVFAIGAKAKTKLTYSIPSKAMKYVSVSSSGKVTLKKGCKKGTYKITITALQTKQYTKATRQVTIKVK